jgi:hypothetical protein
MRIRVNSTEGTDDASNYDNTCNSIEGTDNTSNHDNGEECEEELAQSILQILIPVSSQQKSINVIKNLFKGLVVKHTIHSSFSASFTKSHTE